MASDFSNAMDSNAIDSDALKFSDAMKYGSFALDRINAAQTPEKPKIERRRPKLNAAQYQSVESAEPFSGEAPDRADFADLINAVHHSIICARNNCNCDQSSDTCLCAHCEIERIKMLRFMSNKISESHKVEFQDQYSPWTQEKFYD